MYLYDYSTGGRSLQIKMNLVAIDRLRNLLASTNGPLVIERWPICAIGQIHKAPWFRKRRLTATASGRLTYTLENGATQHDSIAVMVFFQIAYHVALNLFDPDGYVSRPVKKETVIARIDTLINLWESERNERN